MKTFLSSGYIDRLNRVSDGGVFCKAVIVTLDDGSVRRFADTQEPLVFAGFTYAPMPMIWEGIEQTSQQSLPAVTVTLANMDGTIGSYLEANNLCGNAVYLLLLHLDMLNNITDYDRQDLTILAIEWTWEFAQFHLGFDLGLQEILPRGVISAEEFPGVPEGLRRGSIL